MGDYVIAVDNGSQSTKVTVVDARGAVHASARVPLRPYTSPAPGRWEHPEDDLWTSITAAIREVLSRFEGDVADIRGLGLCTIRFCRAVLRADGSLAQPVMSWMDERVSRAYAPESHDAHYVTTSSGYITHRLTGEFRDTAGNYQGVWPIDEERWDWSTVEAAYAPTGMNRDMLFALVPPGSILGGITREAATETGLPEGLPVVATSNDKAVEALGAGLQSESQVLVSLGTYVSSMMVGHRPRDGGDTFWTNFGAEPGSFLYEGGGVRRGMWTVSWFRDLLADADESALSRGAAAVPPGSDGLLVSLDWLAPDDDPSRRGAIVGFDGTQGRFHIHRAILEAITLEVVLGCERMAESLGRPVTEVICSGGGASSDVMLRIMAAVFGVPVRRPKVVDAAGVGAAISAAVATGVHPGWREAVQSMVHLEPSIQPDPGGVEAYVGVRERYERVIPRVRRLFVED